MFNIRTQFIFIFLAAALPAFARAECGFNQKIDERLLIGPDKKYFAVLSNTQHDDGPGYLHYFGALYLFTSSGAASGEVTLRYDDPMETVPTGKPEEISVECRPLGTEITNAQKLKYQTVCGHLFDKQHSATDPNSIGFALEKFVKILQLSLVDGNQCSTKFSIHSTPATNMSDEEVPGPKTSGLLQILAPSPEIKTGLSLVRFRIPPDVVWQSNQFGCLKLPVETVVLRSYTSMYCAGEGVSSFNAIPISGRVVESSKQNVLALRWMNSKKLKEAKISLEKAIELDPENELAHYNYAALLSRLHLSSGEIEAHLKKYIAIAMRNATSIKRQTQEPAVDIALFKAELKSKIAADPDFKKLHQATLNRLFTSELRK